MQPIFQVALKINILYMQYIKLTVLKTGPEDTPFPYFTLQIWDQYSYWRFLQLVIQG